MTGPRITDEQLDLWARYPDESLSREAVGWLIAEVRRLRKIETAARELMDEDPKGGCTANAESTCPGCVLLAALQEAEESAPAEREPEPERPTVPDLVAALQASLDRANGAQEAEKPQ